MAEKNENKIPNLVFDAFDAGIENGGLRNKSEIELLVCYMIANSKIKITSKLIIDTVIEGQIANYFEICDAIAAQIERGNVKEDENKILSLTQNAEKMVDLIENDIPYTIREKSIKLSRMLARNEVLNNENHVSITQNGKSFDVTMEICDGDIKFMTLNLNVPTSAQADMIKEKFKENPVFVYDNLISSLFDEDKS